MKHEGNRRESRRIAGPSAWVTRWIGVMMAGSAMAGAAAPSIDRYLPHGGAPGSEIEIQFQGSGLAEVQRLWTSFDMAQERVKAADQEVVFRVRVGPETGLGFGMMRLVGRQGVSAPVLFCLDDLPGRLESGTNGTLRDAQSLTLPVAVDGRVGSQELDYYRFSATKGQSISVEVMAPRLGFKLDPLVRVMDGHGREAAYQDDAAEVAPEVRFRWVAPETGNYVLELRDALYRGGSGFGYRLRLGDFPRITVPYPMSALAGASTEVQWLGPDAEKLEPTIVALPASSSGQWHGVGRVTGGGSSVAWIEAVSQAPGLEQEPNDEPGQAVAVTVPALVQGRLETAKDRDYFKLVLPEKGWFEVEARTRRAGSPCDVWMELRTLEGRRLERMTIREGTDGGLAHEAASPGDYLLVVEELNREGGPDLAYEIQARFRRPEFLLSVETDTVQVTPGGTFSIKIQAVRTNSNWTGSIELAIEGSSEDLRLEPAAVPEKAGDVEVKVTVPAAWEPGSVHALKVVGRAILDGVETRRVVSTGAAWRKRFVDGTRMLPGTDGMILVGVRAGD